MTPHAAPDLDAQAAAQRLVPDADAAAWDALTSPGGWRGFTATEPLDYGGSCWGCILALIEDDFAIRYWEVYEGHPEECWRKVIDAVREWTAPRETERRKGEATCSEIPGTNT